MRSNAIFFAWNKPAVGREHLSVEHFGEFVEYLGELVAAGSIASFEPVFLDHHGGNVNGFFLIRGESAQIDALVSSDQWSQHMVRAGMHLANMGFVRGYVGDEVSARMELFGANIPK